MLPLVTVKGCDVEGNPAGCALYVVLCLTYSDSALQTQIFWRQVPGHICPPRYEDFYQNLMALRGVGRQMGCDA